MKITDVVTGLRVAEVDEFDGLDLSQHGESGYNLEDEFGGATVSDGGTPTAIHASTAAKVSHA